MRSSRIFAFSAALLAVLFSAQSSFANCISTLIPTPNVNNYNFLTGVSGTSLSDIWAVGDSQARFNDGLEETLIEHFNGVAWSVVPSPDVKDKPGNTLMAVTASSPTDAWAVGFDNDSAGQPRTLAMHWDGRSWEHVETHPWPACYGWRAFTGVSANPANARDVWAAGWALFGCNPAIDVGFAEHWDGTSWSFVKILADEVLLNAVSTTDHGAWAVGTNDIRGHSHPFIVHISRSVVTQWSAPDKCCVLNSVSALDPNDVWAVGNAERPSGARPIIEHFDGTAWSSIPSPATTGDVGLNSVFAVGPADVWAVGTQGPSGNIPSGYLTLVEHWDGLKWSIVQSASEGVNDFLFGVYGSNNRVFAAGNFGNATRKTLGTIAGCNSGALR
jgi:hypothetical protein